MKKHIALLAVLITLNALLAEAQICVMPIRMLNSSRHVVGDVNTECGGIHSAPWGNWGVASNFADKGDGDQFRGWKDEDNHGQWNSCTSNSRRDLPMPYGLNNGFNLDTNGNGYPDQQWGYTEWYGPIGSQPDSEYVYAEVAVWANTSCPMDVTGDGICDYGGCAEIGLDTFETSGHFLSLYELDPWDTDEFVTTLYIDPDCCTVSQTCTTGGCSGGDSVWHTTSYWTDVEVTGRVKMRLLPAYYLAPPDDPWEMCTILREEFPEYFNCVHPNLAIVQMINTTRGGSEREFYRVGDSFRVDISGGDSYAEVENCAPQYGCWIAGYTNQWGDFALTGTMPADAVGEWNQTWTVGGVLALPSPTHFYVYP